jgi:hypothetical protein
MLPTSIKNKKTAVKQDNQTKTPCIGPCVVCPLGATKPNTKMPEMILLTSWKATEGPDYPDRSGDGKHGPDNFRNNKNETKFWWPSQMRSKSVVVICRERLPAWKERGGAKGNTCALGAPPNTDERSRAGRAENGRHSEIWHSHNGGYEGHYFRGCNVALAFGRRLPTFANSQNVDIPTMKMEVVCAPTRPHSVTFQKTMLYMWNVIRRWCAYLQIRYSLNHLFIS